MSEKSEIPQNEISVLLDHISTTAWVAGCSDAAEEDLRSMMFVLMKLADEAKSLCDGPRPECAPALVSRRQGRVIAARAGSS